METCTCLRVCEMGTTQGQRDLKNLERVEMKGEREKKGRKDTPLLKPSMTTKLQGHRLLHGHLVRRDPVEPAAHGVRLA